MGASVARGSDQLSRHWVATGSLPAHHWDKHCDKHWDKRGHERWDNRCHRHRDDRRNATCPVAALLG